MNFGDNLKALRESKGLTQKALAEELGLVAASITAYEQGQKNPSFPVFLEMVKIFKVSPNRLLGYETEITTWTDAMKLIVALGTCYPLITIDATPGGTPSLKFYRWVRDWENGDISLTMKDPEDGEFFSGELNLFVPFVENFVQMKTLLDKGNISQRVFDLWLQDEYEKHNYSIFDPSPPESETPHED